MDFTMWLQTRVGFFSIVEKPADAENGQLTVRARVANDLGALRERYLPELGKVQSSRTNDYRFRALAPREAVAQALARAALDIDYSNFKNTIGCEQGADRAHLYGKVWAVLHNLQTPSQDRPA
jgi:hypothetical protein